MTSHSNIDPEGPEDVNNFLTRIRELGEKRDQEDVERTKKLEDEILQGRKERQARRAGNSLCSVILPRARRSCGDCLLSTPPLLSPRVQTRDNEQK